MNDEEEEEDDKNDDENEDCIENEEENEEENEDEDEEEDESVLPIEVSQLSADSSTVGAVLEITRGRRSARPIGSDLRLVEMSPRRVSREL